jgi:hypothetical protein
MKNFTYLFIFTCFITFQQCKKENPDVFETYLKLSPEALKLLPVAYQDGKVAVFVDTLGREKKFNISVKLINDSTYFKNPKPGIPPFVREVKSISLENTIDLYQLRAVAYGDYDTKKKPFYTFAFSNLYNGSVLGCSFVLDSAQKIRLLFGTALNDWTFLNRTFTEVYFEESPSGNFLTDQSYCNLKDGIVGFRETNGSTWVLERVE